MGVIDTVHFTLDAGLALTLIWTVWKLRLAVICWRTWYQSNFILIDTLGVVAGFLDASAQHMPIPELTRENAASLRELIDSVRRLDAEHPTFRPPG